MTGLEKEVKEANEMFEQLANLTPLESAMLNVLVRWDEWKDRYGKDYRMKQSRVLHAIGAAAELKEVVKR